MCTYGGEEQSSLQTVMIYVNCSIKKKLMIFVNTFKTFTKRLILFLGVSNIIFLKSLKTISKYVYVRFRQLFYCRCSCAIDSVQDHNYKPN
jgi:hypothetical protein